MTDKPQPCEECRRPLPLPPLELMPSQFVPLVCPACYGNVDPARLCWTCGTDVAGGNEHAAWCPGNEDWSEPQQWRGRGQVARPATM